MAERFRVHRGEAALCAVVPGDFERSFRPFRVPGPESLKKLKSRGEGPRAIYGYAVMRL